MTSLCVLWTITHYQLNAVTISDTVNLEMYGHFSDAESHLSLSMTCFPESIVEFKYPQLDMASIRAKSELQTMSETYQ